MALDFAAIATTLGGHGQRVDTRAELRAALAAAVQARGRFQLLDVTLAPGQVSPGLDRTFSAIRDFRRRASASGA